MYPYHNRIKQRIKNGELIEYEFVEDYPNIGECLVLKFSTFPALRPIVRTDMWIMWTSSRSGTKRRRTKHDKRTEN